MMGEGASATKETDRSPKRLAEGRLAFLKTRLKITPGQMPLWDKYGDAVQTNTSGSSSAS
jgi:hypothetical protein